MKHLVGFFLPLCIFSFIAFGISVAVLGTTSSARQPESVVQSENTVIQQQYSRIELKNTSGNLNIYPNDSDSTLIIAKGKHVNNVSAYVKDDTLFIKNEGSVWGLGSNGIDFSLDSLIDIFTPSNRTVNVFVPVKTYNSLISTNLSGNTKILDIPFTMSDFTNSSGNITYSQPDDFRSERIAVDVASGNCTVYNARTYNYEVGLSSGNVDMYYLTGKGSVEIASGNCELNYEQLNGDLAIDVSSGNLDIHLPFDASAEILCDIGSGDVDVEFGVENEELDDGNRFTINDGEYTITVDVSSGDVVFSDEMEYDLAPLPELPALVDYANAVATTAVVSTDIDGTSAPIENYGIHANDNGADIKLPFVEIQANDDGAHISAGGFVLDANDSGVNIDF